MKKKILSILLALVLIVGLLPTAAMAGEEIRSTYITITAPVEGHSPDYNPVARMDNSFTGSAMGYMITDVRWVETFKDNSPDKALTEDSIFEAGHFYTVWLTLEAESGYELYSNLYPWFNEVSSTSKGSLMPGGNVIIREIYKGFQAEEAPKINSVELNIDPPVVGEHPTYSFKYVGDHYCPDTDAPSPPYENGVYWNDMTDGYKVVGKNDTFKDGHQYQAIFKLAAEDGRVFPTDSNGNATATATVNGETAQASGSMLSLTVSYDFPKAEGKAVTQLSLTVTPPVIGEKPDYTAASATEGAVVDTDYSLNSYIKGVMWIKLKSNNINDGEKILTASDTFEKDGIYAVGIRVTATNNYSLALDPLDQNAVTINGKNADRTIEIQQGNLLIVTRIFEKLADQPQIHNPFNDVPENAYYYNAVLWAVSHEPQITAGTSATTFSPNNPCTRAQAVTFLWRAAGQPEPKTSSNPFTDVKSSAYYYKAVLWAAETGVTAGTSDTTFSPDQPCTRGQIVTFLWRYMNKPNPLASGNPFTDIKGGEYYYTPVIWAVGAKVTAGTTATTFSPGATCTRGQIVTFLHRAVG